MKTLHYLTILVFILASFLVGVFSERYYFHAGKYTYEVKSLCNGRVSLFDNYDQIYYLGDTIYLGDIYKSEAGVVLGRYIENNNKCK